MPEVIGQNPKNEVDCKNCGSKLRFERREVRAGKQKEHSPDRDHRSVITCPTCRQPVDVTDKVGPTSHEQAQREQRLYDEY